jgi:hypothetical protein
MPALTTQLVHNPEADQFFEVMGTATGRQAFLGDPTTFPTDVYNHISGANAAVEDAIKTVGRLVVDKTRNDVLKHEAAKIVYEKRLAPALDAAHAAIVKTAGSLTEQANTLIAETFQPDPNRGYLDAEERAWIREQAKTENGYAAIRQEVETDPAFAAIFHHAKPRLLGVNPEFHERMRDVAVRNHLPKAQTMRDQSKALAELAPNYQSVKNGARVALFNQAVADQAGSRVDL